MSHARRATTCQQLGGTNQCVQSRRPSQSLTAVGWERSPAELNQRWCGVHLTCFPDVRVYSPQYKRRYGQLHYGQCRVVQARNGCHGEHWPQAFGGSVILAAARIPCTAPDPWRSRSFSVFSASEEIDSRTDNLKFLFEIGFLVYLCLGGLAGLSEANASPSPHVFAKHTAVNSPPRRAAALSLTESLGTTW